MHAEIHAWVEESQQKQEYAIDTPQINTPRYKPLDNYIYYKTLLP